MIHFILVSIICVLSYIIWRNQYNYWIKRNVKGPVPLPFIGNFGRMAIMQQSIGQLLYSIYTKYPEEKVVGFHFGLTPVLLLKDPDIIKQIMVTDFNAFVNRGLRTKDQGFSHNLLIAEGEVWKAIRQKMTPSFTPAKLKQMMPSINSCLNKFISEIDKAIEENENIDIKPYANNFSLDSISTSVFGLQLDFYDDKSTEYLKSIVNEAVTPSILFRLWQFVEMLIPGIHKTFTKLDLTPHMRYFFLKLIKTAVNIREENEITRNDLLDSLIKFKKQDKIDLGKDKYLEVDDNIIASQAFSLYAAGTDTISSSIGFLLYELSVNPEIQDKVYKEVCSAIENNNGEFNYECINDMVYLDAVFNETMRKYNVIEWILRKSVVNYTLPESGLTIPAGTFITVSTMGLHNDPKYIANPNKFDPDNFSTEKSKNMDQYFIPFGIGPRNCIGYRFAKLNVMLAVAKFLKKFEVRSYSSHKQQFKFNPGSITRNPIGGIWIKILRRYE